VLFSVRAVLYMHVNAHSKSLLLHFVAPVRAGFAPFGSQICSQVGPPRAEIKAQLQTLVCIVDGFEDSPGGNRVTNERAPAYR
jgi:hypothetical protein